MKLYTKGQVFAFAAITAVLIILITVPLTFKISAVNQDKKTTDSLKEKDAEITDISQMSDDFSSFIPSDSTAYSDLTDNIAVDNSYTYTQDELQNINVYEKCNEAVVNITTQVMAFNWFLEAIPQEGGSGSGSIIDARGYVVTNVHVIENANKIFISLADGSQFEGTVVGVDSMSDIAVLKFEPPKGVVLKTIPFADSSTLKVGQKVIAIGNPFALERTMTTGIISGLGRPIQSSRNTIIRDMIQTDTAINPGNSGGPLLDTKCRMVGINTMIYSTSGSSAGVGFAVPVNTAKRVVSDLIQYGKVRRGAIQAKIIQLTPSIARYAGMDISQGILVSEVASGSNAAKAGIRGGTEAVRYGSSRNPQTIYLGGDVIIAIGNISVANYADYYSALESKKPQDTVKVTLYRNGHKIEVNVTLSEQED